MMATDNINSNEQYKNQIIGFIKTNNINELTDCINTNDLKLNSLNIPSKFDILIYSIENNASFQMIQYIIEQCQYETLNYWILNGEVGRKSPLLSSLFKNNFTLSNYLLKNGANINYELCYFDIMYYLDGNNKLNKDNLRYILRNGYNIETIEPYYICNFIEHNQANFIEIMFNETVFSNEFILKLLYFYKNKIRILDKNWKDFIEGARNKFKIHKRYYETAVDSDNYEALAVLYRNDFRDREIILDEIVEVLNAYDRIHHCNKKYKFLKKIKNNELGIEIETRLLNNISILDIEKTRQDIINIIKFGNEKELEKYIKDHNLYLPDVNSQDFDLLICGIENSMSKEMFVSLVQNGHYNNFDYHIKEGNGFTTPIIKAIVKGEYMLADSLFALGVDPNYNIRKYIPVDLHHEKVNCLNLYLYEHKLLTAEILEYLFKSHYTTSLFITKQVINDYVKDSRSDLLKIVFQFLQIPIFPPWYLIALNRKDYETINILYEKDTVNDAHSVAGLLMNNLLTKMFINQVDIIESRNELVNNIKDEELKEKIQTVIHISTL